MVAFEPIRSMPVLFLMLVIICTQPGRWASARGTTSTRVATSYQDLLTEAENKRVAGAHAEAAALCGRAYRARPETERANEIGKAIVERAMTDYTLAQASKPDLVLLEAQAQLLDEFITARLAVQLDAQSKNAKMVPEVPQDLVEELGRLNTRIGTQREAEREAFEEAHENEPIPKTVPAPVPERELARAPKPTRTAARKRDALFLGIGITSVVGSTALLAVGARSFVWTRERYTAKLEGLDAEPQYTNEQRQGYRKDLARWQRQWSDISTALVVTGVLFAATGIGLTSHALARMRKQPSPTASRASLAPSLSRQHLGLQLDVTF